MNNDSKAYNYKICSINNKLKISYLIIIFINKCTKHLLQ